MLFPTSICRTAVVAPCSSQKPSVPSQGSLAGSLPIVIPSRECGLEIKEWRAASYCHLTQSLVTLPIFFPPLHPCSGVKKWVISSFYLRKEQGK